MVRRVPARRDAEADRHEVNQEIRKIVEIPDVKQKLISQGADPETNTPEEFAKYVKSEMAKWGKVVRDTGASAN